MKCDRTITQSVTQEALKDTENEIEHRFSQLESLIRKYNLDRSDRASWFLAMHGLSTLCQLVQQYELEVYQVSGNKLN